MAQSRRLGGCFNVGDLRRRARRRLPRAVFDFCDGAAGDERTLRRNEAAFAEMEMRVALAEIVRRRTLRPASDRAETVARRNVTFSPAHGTMVIA